MPSSRKSPPSWNVQNIRYKCDRGRRPTSDVEPDDQRAARLRHYRAVCWMITIWPGTSEERLLDGHVPQRVHPHRDETEYGEVQARRAVAADVAVTVSARLGARASTAGRRTRRGVARKYPRRVSHVVRNIGLSAALRRTAGTIKRIPLPCGGAAGSRRNRRARIPSICGADVRCPISGAPRPALVRIINPNRRTPLALREMPSRAGGTAAPAAAHALLLEPPTMARRAVSPAEAVERPEVPNFRRLRTKVRPEPPSGARITTPPDRSLPCCAIRNRGGRAPARPSGAGVLSAMSGVASRWGSLFARRGIARVDHSNTTIPVLFLSPQSRATTSLGSAAWRW